MPSVRSQSAPWVAGVDGCRSGWVVALHNHQTGAHVGRVVSDFREVLRLNEAPAVIAVDVPIGLLADAKSGGRDCEVEARQLLGRRRSSVFSAPTRSALDAFRAGRSYKEVSAANRGGVAAAPGISRQTFCILPKIDEVDNALKPGMQGMVDEVDNALQLHPGTQVVVEVHPELCFLQANGGTPMRHAKRTSAGREERSALLKSLGFVLPLQLLGARLLLKGVKPDDVLDACIACWTAGRKANSSAIPVPSVPSTDARGLPMELWR